jgi:hypothetical protein
MAISDMQNLTLLVPITAHILTGTFCSAEIVTFFTFLGRHVVALKICSPQFKKSSLHEQGKGKLTL